MFSIDACHYAKGKRKFDDVTTIPCDLSLLGSPCIGTALDLSALEAALESPAEKSDSEHREYDEHKSPIQRPQNPLSHIPNLILEENIISTSERTNHRDNEDNSPVHKKARPSRSLLESKETTISHKSNSFSILSILQEKAATDQKTEELVRKYIEAKVAIDLVMNYLTSEEKT